MSREREVEERLDEHAVLVDLVNHRDIDRQDLLLVAAGALHESRPSDRPDWDGVETMEDVRRAAAAQDRWDDALLAATASTDATVSTLLGAWGYARTRDVLEHMPV